jgi:hypothetical protein
MRLDVARHSLDKKRRNSQPPATSPLTRLREGSDTNPPDPTHPGPPHESRVTDNHPPQSLAEAGAGGRRSNTDLLTLVRLQSHGPDQRQAIVLLKTSRGK